MRKTFLLAGILSVLVLGIAAEKSGKAISQGATGKETITTEKKAENTMEAVAMNFINLYVSLPEDINFERWFEAQPLTDNFKKAYKNQERAIEISEQILSGKKVSKADEEFARKYSVDYAPIFGAAILDLDENSVFAVKSYNQKTGIVTLKDEKTGIELPVKVVKVKGKWLIEGAGTVNIPN
jgi:hypothetical protein